MDFQQFITKTKQMPFSLGQSGKTQIKTNPYFHLVIEHNNCIQFSVSWISQFSLTSLFRQTSLNSQTSQPCQTSQLNLFGSKTGLFGPKYTKKWKISGKNIKKWMILGHQAQLFEPIWMEIFLKLLGPILESVQMDLFRVQNRHFWTQKH